MRTRDGVKLYADVYRPDASGKFPVLVVRTPCEHVPGFSRVNPMLKWFSMMVALRGPYRRVVIEDLRSRE